MMKSMKITILIDNKSFIAGLNSHWGLSIYMEVGNKRILFDTDTDPNALLENSKKLGIYLDDLDMIIISHNHGDHTGGLRLISRLSPRIRVYFPSHSRLGNYLKNLGLTPIPVRDTVKLSEELFVLGELKAGFRLHEIAFVVKINNKLIIFVGCSHPGVDKIVSKAIEEIRGEAYLVLGGFHSPANKALDYLIQAVSWKIMPIHCSGEKAIRYIKDRSPSKLIIGGSGSSLSITPI